MAEALQEPQSPALPHEIDPRAFDGPEFQA